MATIVDTSPLHTASSTGAVDAFRTSHDSFRQQAKSLNFARTYMGPTRTVLNLLAGLWGIVPALFLGFAGSVLLPAAPQPVLAGLAPWAGVLGVVIAVAIAARTLWRAFHRMRDLSIPWAKWERLDRYARANRLVYSPWATPEGVDQTTEFRDTFTRGDGVLIAERRETSIYESADNESDKSYRVTRTGLVLVPLWQSPTGLQDRILVRSAGWTFLRADGLTPLASPGSGLECFASRADEAQAARLIDARLVAAIQAATAQPSARRIAVVIAGDRAGIHTAEPIAPEDSATQNSLWDVADALQTAVALNPRHGRPAPGF